MHACVHACKRVPNFDARSNAKDVLRRGRVGSTLIVDPLPYLKRQHHHYRSKVHHFQICPYTKEITHTNETYDKIRTICQHTKEITVIVRCTTTFMNTRDMQGVLV